MICEQFVYGLFSNAGYKTLKSQNIDAVLTKQSFEQLKSLRLTSGEKSTFIQMHFATEHVITFTYLQATKDKYGRTGILNHTVIMRTQDFFQAFPETLTAVFNLIKGQLIIDPQELPSNLEPLKVKE